MPIAKQPKAVASAVAFVVALAVIVAGCSASGTSKQRRASDATTTTTTTASSGVSIPPVVSNEAATRGETLTRDASATEVHPEGAKGSAQSDQTATFSAAMDKALAGSYRRAGGPSGQPQAVVYVPAGTYRLLRLQFHDNVRLEVDAGAVLQQAGGVDAGGGKAKPLIVWDGPSATEPLRNVSIVGVGEQRGGVKAQADPVEAGWDIANAFTMNLDPRATAASGKVAGIELLNVDGFLIQNLFSIQNATVPDPDAVRATDGGYPWPTSSKPVLVMRPRNDSPLAGPFAAPRNGQVVHHYNINSPRGYGPNQVGSAQGVRFAGVFTRGGTALRLETDSTKNKDFGGEIRGLRAEAIVGVDCNRAVAFAPHAQKNYDVQVRHVVARGCSQGIVESQDEKLGPKRRGGFWDSAVEDIAVTTGAAAQNPARAGGGSMGAWTPGPSLQAFARDQSASWMLSYTTVSCAGAFSAASDRITIDGESRTPKCAAAP